MMKGRKRGPARMLAIMLSVILMVSGTEFTVLADENTPVSSDAGSYEETAVSGAETSTQDDEALTGNDSSEQDSDIEEGSKDPSADGTDDDQQADYDHPADDESADEGLRDDPVISVDIQPGKDETEEDDGQSTGDEAVESSQHPDNDKVDEEPAVETLPDEELSDAATDESDNAPVAGVDTAVTYIERRWADGKVVSEEKTRDKDISPFPAGTSLPAGWYYLNEDITVEDRVYLEGDTWIVLGDGKTLDVEGLYVPEGSTLTIYAQSDGENAGKLISEPDDVGAGIGATSNNHPGGSVVIHGGSIEATGHDHCAGIGSNDGNGTTSPITIYGGTITAKGGSDGAGIGGGRNCDGGTITIYCGEIKANKDPNENGA